jgi:homoserine kinase
MGQDYATLRVPASTSNLGAGFDTFGLALNLYNYFTAQPWDRWEFELDGGRTRTSKERRKPLCQSISKSLRALFPKAHSLEG